MKKIALYHFNNWRAKFNFNTSLFNVWPHSPSVSHFSICYFVSVALFVNQEDKVYVEKCLSLNTLLFLSSASGSDASTQPATPEPDKSKPKKNRCFTCRKKVGLTGTRHLHVATWSDKLEWQCSLFLNQNLEFIHCVRHCTVTYNLPETPNPTPEPPCPRVLSSQHLLHSALLVHLHCLSHKNGGKT